MTKLPFKWIEFTEREPIAGEFINLWFKKPDNTNIFCYATWTGEKFLFDQKDRSDELEHLFAWKQVKT